MRIEKQLCTFAQSVTLYTLGIRTPAYFIFDYASRPIPSGRQYVEDPERKYFFAYSLSELIQMTPYTLGELYPTAKSPAFKKISKTVTDPDYPKAWLYGDFVIALLIAKSLAVEQVNNRLLNNFKP